MSDNFLVGLIAVSLLSVALLYLSPSSKTSSPPPPPPPPPRYGPDPSFSSNPFLSTFRAVWQCLEVLGVGLTVLFVVGFSIWAYESLGNKLGRSVVAEEDEDGERWEDKGSRKKRRARLRHGRQHGLLPIVVLVVGLIASSFIDVSVLFPSFLTSSPSNYSRGASGSGGSLTFALLTILTIVVATVFLKRDFNLWKAGKSAGPTGATAKAAQTVGAKAEETDMKEGGEGTTGREGRGSEAVRRRVPPLPKRGGEGEDIEMERLK